MYADPKNVNGDINNIKYIQWRSKGTECHIGLKFNFCIA